MQLLRQLLTFLIISFLTISFASAQTQSKAEINFLFLQVAKSGILQKQADGKTYLLTLHQVDPYITYFSEAPNRITGFKPIADVSNIIQAGDRQAHTTGLNSALIAMTKNNSLQYILNISKPHYDAKQHTLTYIATLLPDEKNSSLPDHITFNHPALFIDRVCVSCGGGGW